MHHRANQAELTAIRDAMIENPRLNLFCLASDDDRLLETFHQAGYLENAWLKIKKDSVINGKQLIGIVFKGGPQ